MYEYDTVAGEIIIIRKTYYPYLTGIWLSQKQFHNDPDRLVLYSTVQYNTVQYSTIQYSAVQYSCCA